MGCFHYIKSPCRKELASSCWLLHQELTVTSSAEPERERGPNEPPFLPVPLLSFPSTQPTGPVLSEASDRDMNVIFPLVFLTAVLNSYKTLKAPQLLPDGSPSQGYLWVSRESFSPAMKNFCFLSNTSIPPYLRPGPSSLYSLMHMGISRGASPPALTHKNLMKLEGKVHKNLIRGSPPDIGYKSNLEALPRIGIMSSDKCDVFGRTLPFRDMC